jgi:hypothetical protein
MGGNRRFMKGGEEQWQLSAEDSNGEDLSLCRPTAQKPA